MGFGRYKHTDVSRIGTRVFNRMKKQAGSSTYTYQVFREYEQLILPLKKPSTQYCWSKHFQGMIERFGYEKISELSAATIQQYFTELSKKVSPATIKAKWIALSAVMTYAAQEGYIEGFQRPRLPKIYRSSQQWWDIEQMREMIKWSTGRTRVMVMLLAETGCRIGEALGLQTSDLDTDKRTLSINRTIFHTQPNAPKTPSSVRTIAISEKLCYALGRLIDQSKPSAYIFRAKTGNPWRASYLMVKLRVLYGKLGYPQKGFHAFRRGNITHLVMNLEIPEPVVGARVGHLSGGMTLGVYVQQIQGLDKKWIDKIQESFYGVDDIKFDSRAVEQKGSE